MPRPACILWEGKIILEIPADLCYYKLKFSVKEAAGVTWLQNFVYSFLSGAAEVLPISSRAHGILLLKIFGASGNSDLMLMMMHLGILLALYKICRPS